MVTVHKRKPLWLGAVFVVIGLAILITLGMWQVQRLQWKQDLLARIGRLQNAPAVPIQSVLNRSARDMDFVRVNVSCPDIGWRKPMQLYSIRDGVSGVRLIQKCELGSRILFVDTGFVENYSDGPDRIMTQAGWEAEKEARRVREPLIGVLRIPSRGNSFTPAHDRSQKIWFDMPSLMAWPDVKSQPASLPVVLMLESPRVGPAVPAALPTEIPNRHMEYALTWFGLAAALAGVYIAMLLRRRSS